MRWQGILRSVKHTYSPLMLLPLLLLLLLSAVTFLAVCGV